MKAPSVIRQRLSTGGHTARSKLTVGSCREQGVTLKTPAPAILSAMGIMVWSAVQGANLSNDGVGKKARRRIIAMQSKVTDSVDRDRFRQDHFSPHRAGQPFPGSNPQEVLSHTTAGVHGQSAFLVDRDGGGSGVAFSGTSPARTGA